MAADVLSFLAPEARPEIGSGWRASRPFSLRPWRNLRRSCANSSPAGPFRFVELRRRKGGGKDHEPHEGGHGIHDYEGRGIPRRRSRPAIQDNMLTFADLGSVDNWQTLLRNTSRTTVALKGADEIVRGGSCPTCPSGLARSSSTIWKRRGPMRLRCGRRAKKIMRQARKLSEAGELMLAEGDDFV